MAGITLKEAGDAIVYPSVSWSKKLFSIKKESFPKGSVPPQLKSYLLTKGGVSAQCANETKDRHGAERVRAMNACVSAKKRK